MNCYQLRRLFESSGDLDDEAAIEHLLNCRECRDWVDDWIDIGHSQAAPLSAAERNPGLGVQFVSF